MEARIDDQTRQRDLRGWRRSMSRKWASHDELAQIVWSSIRTVHLQWRQYYTVHYPLTSIDNLQ